MPIEDLLELVDTLRKRIDKHSVALGKSEALTRYALIDPLLRGLGWDTDDPALVIPEYREPSTNRKPDYVLLNKGNPFIVVEAKKLGENLRDTKIIQQALNDCSFTESQFFSLTDGRVWDLYDLGRIVPKISFDLKEGSAAEVCLKAMALWKPSAISGNIKSAHVPVVGITPEHIEPTPDPIPTQSITANDEGWQPLTEVKTSAGQKVGALQFPNGELIETKIWRDVLLGIVRWLTNKEMLDASHCPIKSSQSSPRCMVNTKPNHEDGKEFSLPGEVNGLYIAQSTEHHHNLRIARAIIQRVSQDPSQFKVRVS